MLEQVVGAGNAVVRVATEIDASRVSMMHEDFSDDGSVLREQKIREQVTTSMDRKMPQVRLKMMMPRSELLEQVCLRPATRMRNVSSVTRLIAR